VATVARIVDIDGTTELLRMDTLGSQFTLNRLDYGFPEVRAAFSSHAGADGEVDRTKFHGARLVTTTVTLDAAQGPVGPALDVIRALAHPLRRLWLYVRRDDWPLGERRIFVRGESVTTPSNGKLPVQVQAVWRAPKGVLEAAQAVTVTLNPLGGAAQGGIASPLASPVVMQPGLVPGATLVRVDGTIPTPAVADMYGPCADPLLRCVDVNAQVYFPGLTLAAGDFLRVDLAAQTALLNGDPAQTRMSTYDFTTSSFFRLPAAPSVQLVFTPNAPGPGCQAVVSWRPRYL